MFRSRMLFLLVVVLFFSCEQAIALEVVPLKARVNDTAHMFSQGTVAEVEALLAQFEASDSTQIAVLTIPSLEGEVLEEYSIQVVDAWKVGQQGLDNGVLLLITRDDRRLRIEVGYGLEGRLTDLTAGKIITQIIVPHFKQGDFDGGLLAGIEAIMHSVKGEFSAADVKQPQKEEFDPAGFILLMIFTFAFIGKVFHGKKMMAAGAGSITAPVLALFMLPQLGMLLLALIPIGALGGLVVSSVSASGSGGGFYVGSGGGGFGGSSGGFGGFSGGGGGFGGGGASGGW